MKVLQTLGVHGGTQQAGIFQYYRSAEGVHIDSTIGQTAGGRVLSISNQDWSDMLNQLAVQNSVFDLSTLRTTIASALSINASEAAYVVAILEHEGSFDHYGGISGPGNSVTINLRRGYPN